MAFVPTNVAIQMGRPRTTGAWRALPRGQARTMPWKAPQSASRAPQMSTGNWQALDAYQQIVRGIGSESSTAVPVLGRFGFASAVAACFAMILGGCASFISLDVSANGNRSNFEFHDDGTLRVRLRMACTSSPLPSRAAMRRRIAKEKMPCRLEAYDVEECPGGGRSLSFTGACMVPPEARPAVRAQFIRLKKMLEAGATPSLTILPGLTGSASDGESTTTTTRPPSPTDESRPIPRSEPRPEPRPEPRRPADEGGDDEIVF